MHVGIFSKIVKKEHSSNWEELFAELRARNYSISVYAEIWPEVKELIITSDDILTFEEDEELSKEIDFIISLGGDGTILDTVPFVRDSNIPILGINFGRLGFLSSIGKKEIVTALDALDSGSFHIDKRSLVHLASNEDVFGNVSFALNEMTLHKKDSSSMITVHTYVNGEFLTTYWADGIIVATPTGSTGYSLSCGGPILSPQAESFVITPIAPHNLNVRPLVLPDNVVISFEIEGRDNNFLCTLDSRSKTVNSNIQLAVRKEVFTINLIRLNERNFFDTLRTKMLWGLDRRNSF